MCNGSGPRSSARYATVRLELCSMAPPRFPSLSLLGMLSAIALLHGYRAACETDPSIDSLPEACAADHPVPFRHLRMWAMLRDVANHLKTSMRKMPPALRQADLRDALKGTISFRRWQGGDEPDPPRALLIVKGAERLVRFREKDFVAFWGRDAEDLPSSLYAPLEVVSVDDTKVGGLIRLADGTTLPNPRLIDGAEGETDGAVPYSQRGVGVTLKWTRTDVLETSAADLWKLKQDANQLLQAVDAALEERMQSTEQEAAALRNKVQMPLMV